MGATTDRITAADFVTPPELAAWALAESPAGRVGGVRLELAAHPSGTRLGRCYQQVPLRVLPPFRSGADQAALLYLLNPTAGLLDGDAQLVEVTAPSGTRAVVTGQSATRIHPCLVGFCTQQWRLRVENGAVLVVLPGPAIPFRGCRYYQRVAIDLAAGAGLVWGDVWLAGRYARGAASERFQFAWLIQELAVRREGRLVFRDRFRWRGPWDAAAAAWHFGPAPAAGSLFVTGPQPEPAAAAAEASAACVFPTGAGDTVLRWCGSPEEVIAVLVRAGLMAGTALAGDNGREPWLLASHDLAPNHWFNMPGEKSPLAHPGHDDATNPC
jgi:urease accessory protein